MTANIQFTIDLENTNSSYIDVKMKVLAIQDMTELRIAIPIWTPGSYLIREYAQFITEISARDADGKQRLVKKHTKSTWVVDTHSTHEIEIDYRVYGYTLNVRYNHFDASHAFIHGPATFLYVESFTQELISLSIKNTAWKITTGLSKIATKNAETAQNNFSAPDYDTLIDCPLEIGTHDRVSFFVRDTPHTFSFWGRGNYDKAKIVDDTKCIVEEASKIFGSKLPYDTFDFITLLTEKDYGGLEHRNSTALMVPRNAFREKNILESDAKSDKKYRQFLALVSHEFFHTWNVKRIKPAAFDRFDYQNENYTRDMWTVEGITSYYDDLILRRANLITRELYLEGIGRMIRALMMTPGRKIRSLEEASFDTWIRLYRPDPSNHNSNVSYYLKGALVSLILDIEIRKKTDGKKSLDDVLRYLWLHHAHGNGYSEGGYETIIENVCEIELDDFFSKFIRGTEEIEWSSYLNFVGLELNIESKGIPYFGARVVDSVVKHVEDHSPVFGKLHPADTLLAIEGCKLRDDLDTLLKTYDAGDTIKLTGFRNGMLFETEIELGECIDGNYNIVAVKNASETSHRLLEQWIGS